MTNKKFTHLLRSEIKKIESYAQKRDSKDSRVTGLSYNETPDSIGFVTVRCEICSNNMEDREADVIFNAFMLDRRRSFVSEGMEKYC